MGCYECFPPLPVAASRGDTGQLVYASFLEETDMFEHEPIKGVDIRVLHNITEVYLGELGMLHVDSCGGAQCRGVPCGRARHRTV